MDDTNESEGEPEPSKRRNSESSYCDDSDEDAADVQDDMEQPGTSSGMQPSTSTATRESLHVSVQREQISATQMKEGEEELLGLDIDVYDQQTYEKSVFDQVDKAITEAAPPAQQNAYNAADKNINDLMRVIHNQGDTEDHQDDNEQESSQRDEEILQLARQERLNRVAIKQERLERAVDPQADMLSRLSRIPRHFDHISASTSTSRSTKVEPEPELVEVSSESEDQSEEEEYIPNRQEEDDDDEDEDIDYETDAHESDSETIEDVAEAEVETKIKKIRDDGDFKTYAKRVKAYTKARAKLRLSNILPDGTESKKLDEMVSIDGNLQVSKDVWDNLYEHQKTGVRWFWELHQLGTGGILGDEMGLGKTIQMIAFLTALKCSNITSAHNDYDGLGPVVLVCPATVMHQWLVEFRKWYPPFRVAILHSTGTFSGDRRQLVKVIHKSNGILICSFPGVVIYQDYLHALDWHYAILDEGHKIRNPDAQVTLACKRFRTPHRLILSGSPVQNNLRELWSIFDFIYPGKLGTLPVFMSQFGIPITQGGYANASDMQVQIAYKCACVLRDAIKPFLLRRTKAEVNNKLKLPDRSEQVLFCKLTEKQRKAYEQYLHSPTVRDIKRGMCQIFVGLIQLRKICNHPDLFDASECDRQVKQKQKHEEKRLKHLEFFSTDETYGHYQKSGKMMVVDALLKLWKKQGHKVLLFTQSRQMLKIFTNYLKELNYNYLIMDGSTPIGVRHSLIDDFNTNEDIFIFLLTTRVGGVGVNLIGANRIIIYDPDWNPSTDIQARERAWRIGQQRHVIIYRLLTAGTIEEKIYHRQVFKLYLTNRILRDAKQKRFFKTNDMHELFTLGHDDRNIETKALFDDDLQIDEKSVKKKAEEKREERKRKKKEKKRRKMMSSDENSAGPSSAMLSEEKVREMRERAKRLSQLIASQYGDGVQATSGNGTIRVKTEQLEQQQPNCTNALAQESNEEHNDLGLSPTQPVPYCPAWQVNTESDVVQAKEPATRKKASKARVDYLVKQAVYKPGGNGSKDPDRDDYQRDDYILGRLFKSANISGALKHDRIEGDCTADYKVVESEAEKVARDAIRVLRESRRLCLGSTSGIPNWTGRNGQVAGTVRARLVPKNKTRAKQLISNIPANQPSTSSSSNDNDSLLSSIRRRNHVNPVPLQRANGADQERDSDEEAEQDRDFAGRAEGLGADKMADKIREFVLYQSSIQGEAQTDELLEFFKKSFEPEKTALFKAILYKMCELQRRGNKGFWKLKSEFRDL